MRSTAAYQRRMDAILKELDTERKELLSAFLDKRIGRMGSIARQISDLSAEYVDLERSISTYITDMKRCTEYRNTP